ncbi:unnamed protein product [Nippostrongylus brasiliensis]|uniref:Transcriptional regulator n=1 Tax=Nippostrongylus brasiliensis TaxID=27835 RepID=A0A0N4Y3W5_NIPBR|nr:unnamed protein product [Nippostrongylus brasiliensis]
MKKSETPKLVDIAGRQTQSLSVLHRVIRILSRADRGDMVYHTPNSSSLIF